jgi:hypothetical protein
MGCFVIHVGGIRRGKIARKKGKQWKYLMRHFSHTLRRDAASAVLSLLCAYNHISSVSSRVDFLLSAKGLFNK